MVALPRKLRAMAALVLVVHLGGCIKTWQPSAVGPVETIAAEPERVRVTLSDGSRTILSEPRIENDSIVSPDGRLELASVVVIAIRQPDMGANFVVYTLGTLLLVGAVWAATWDGPLSGWGDPATTR